MSSVSAETFNAVFQNLSGQVHGASNRAEALKILQHIISEAGAKTIAMAQMPGLLAQELAAWCREQGLELLQAPFQGEKIPHEIDRAQIGITGMAFAIAETATLVEVSTNDATRLISSLPRTHIGIFYEDDLVPTLMEAGPRMSALLEQHPRDVTLSFLSGPSRTGDIEMKLTLGVHGPETAHALMLQGNDYE